MTEHDKYLKWRNGANINPICLNMCLLTLSETVSTPLLAGPSLSHPDPRRSIQVQTRPGLFIIIKLYASTWQKRLYSIFISTLFPCKSSPPFIHSTDNTGWTPFQVYLSCLCRLLFCLSAVHHAGLKTIKNFLPLLSMLARPWYLHDFSKVH